MTIPSPSTFSATPRFRRALASACTAVGGNFEPDDDDDPDPSSPAPQCQSSTDATAILDATREIEHSTRRIGDMGEDIERLVPTTGDAFAMIVADKSFDERRVAGRALMKEILTRVQLQDEGETVIASIGGFDLEYTGERFGKDGYHYTTTLMRTGATYDIELGMTVTPLWRVSRLEHALDSFPQEQERFRHQLADARFRRSSSYQSHGGGDIRVRW